MTPDDVTQIVRKNLANFQYDLPSEGSTIGVPWPADKVDRHRVKLVEHLVTPYKQRFIFNDKVEGPPTETRRVVEYWVVAECREHIEFYDADAKQFGLAQTYPDRELPVTIDVRGDLVGVFCAI